LQKRASHEWREYTGQTYLERQAGVTTDIDQDLYDRVVGLIAEELGLKREQIKPESRILHDFGCDGLDGDDLLAAFRDQFDVDISNVVFDRHFGPEGGAPNPFELLAWFCGLICGRDKLNRGGHNKVPITVMDLYEAAKSKKFPDLSARAGE
jgi:acyl carrier protein